MVIKLACLSYRLKMLINWDTNTCFYKDITEYLDKYQTSTSITKTSIHTKINKHENKHSNKYKN